MMIQKMMIRQVQLLIFAVVVIVMMHTSKRLYCQAFSNLYSAPRRASISQLSDASLVLGRGRLPILGRLGTHHRKVPFCAKQHVGSGKFRVRQQFFILRFSKDPNEDSQNDDVDNGIGKDKNDSSSSPLRGSTESPDSTKQNGVEESNGIESVLNAVQKTLRNVFRAIYLVWSFGFTCLGVGLSLGLVLNLFGYGYQVSREDGIYIDTIEHLRVQNQFQRESMRYGQEYNQRQQKQQQEQLLKQSE